MFDKDTLIPLQIKKELLWFMISSISDGPMIIILYTYIYIPTDSHLLEVSKSASITATSEPRTYPSMISRRIMILFSLHIVPCRRITGNFCDDYNNDDNDNDLYSFFTWFCSLVAFIPCKGLNWVKSWWDCTRTENGSLLVFGLLTIFVSLWYKYMYIVS